MEAEEDLVSAVQAARNEVSGMHLDEPDALAMAADSSATHQSNYAGAILLVLDTNILLSHLNVIDEALAALERQIRASRPPSLAFIVPSVVLRELDAMKTSNKPVDGRQALGYLARQAHSLLLSKLPSPGNILRLQRKDERCAATVDPVNDDLILDCALFCHSHMPGRVGVLTNDANLKLKVLAEQMPALSLRREDRFRHLAAAVHHDLPAQLGLEAAFSGPPPPPQAQSTAPQDADDDDDDMDMGMDSEDAAAHAPPTHQPTDPGLAEALLSTITTALSQLLPPMVYQSLCESLGQDTADHFLRRMPPVHRWNAATALTVLEKHWSSLEHLWDATQAVPEPALSPSGSSSSRWSSSSPANEKQVTAPAADGLGVPMSQMRNIRLSALPSLAAVFGGSTNHSKSPGVSLASYAAQSAVKEWRTSYWSTFWNDLDLVLLRGRLLQGKQIDGAGDAREAATHLMTQWRAQARTFTEQGS